MTLRNAWCNDEDHNKSITCNVCKFIKQMADSSKTTNLKQLQNM